MTLRTYEHVAVKGKPRPTATYRAARRNAARGHVWKGVSTTEPSTWANRRRRRAK